MTFDEQRLEYLKYTKESLKDMTVDELHAEMAKTVKLHWEMKMKWQVLQELLKEKEG